MGYAFVSYSARQQKEAESLRQLLRANQIDTWMAPHDLPAGAAYADVIHQAIRDASCVVLLLTEDAQRSPYVDKEVERALHYGKTIAPIQLGNVGLNDSFAFYLCNQQIVTVSAIDGAAPRLQKLLMHLQYLCNDQLPAEELPPDASRDKRVRRQRIARLLTWTGVILLGVALFCGYRYIGWADRITFGELYADRYTPEMSGVLRSYLLFFAMALGGVLLFLYGRGLRNPQKKSWNPLRVFPLRLLLPAFSALCGTGFVLLTCLQEAVAAIIHGLDSYGEPAAAYVLPVWIEPAVPVLGGLCLAAALAALVFALVRVLRRKGGK